MTEALTSLIVPCRASTSVPTGSWRASVNGTNPCPFVSAANARAAGPDHRWSLDLPEDPVVVPGDEHRLHQVLANLLTNARTHTPAGSEVTVAVAVRRQAEANGAIAELTVSDTGPGIPAGLRPRIFERFTRGDSARSRAAGSTGLGLAIVAAVTNAHGGTVETTREDGHTVFRVLLPG